MEKLKRLFEPIRLGSLELPNRIMTAAITTDYSFEQWAEYYAEIARGGVGLITVGALQALYPGRRQHEVLTISRDSEIPRLRQLTKIIHDNGGRAAAQFGVWTYWAKGGEGTPAEDVSPSGVSTFVRNLQQDFTKTQFIPSSRPLTVDEIHLIERQLGDAAGRAREAGFDAIELGAMMGNLINRFITPYTNRRTDEYGGCLENRLRMLVETIAIIQDRVGKDFPLICRICGDDMMPPWGLGLEGYQEVARAIEKTGIHALHVFPGWYETRQPRHQMCVPRGAFVPIAAGIKKVVNIPVAANCRINDPVLAEQILAEGKADLIAMGRPLIADPDLPNKAKEGRFEDIRLCTACVNCSDDMVAGLPITCSVNARAGRESEYKIVPARKPKKVFVIGGGPGGLEAARVAALRGHRVTLFEKQGRLGGLMLVAVKPPYKDEWQTTIDFLSAQVRKLGVTLRLNEECTAATVARAKPDAVVVATGAVPLIPDIPGVDRKNVATALEVLTGVRETGQNVVIVGGGLVGCETAEFLHQRGRQVTILEMLPEIGADIGNFVRWIVLDRLAAAGIKMETNTKACEITSEGVRAECNRDAKFFAADTVVIAVGMKSLGKLAVELEGKVTALYPVGDCVKPRRIKHAIAEGFLAATKI